MPNASLESSCGVEKLFLVNLPEDFYLFWDFCKALQPDSPLCKVSTFFSSSDVLVCFLARSCQAPKPLSTFSPFPSLLFTSHPSPFPSSPPSTTAALKSSLRLNLVGPYDVLAGRLDGKLSWEQCTLHCRHYYDPPEMTTVLMSGGVGEVPGFHIGYFR